MSDVYDFFLAAGQSNMMYAFAYNQTAALPGPNLYQIKQDNTVVVANQPLDFPGGVSGKPGLVSWGVNFCRDFYIPSTSMGSRKCLFGPYAQGGLGFDGGWKVGGATYEAMVTQANYVLSNFPGSTIKAMFWSHGEEDVADSNAGIGNYATMSMSDGYNKYMTDMVDNLDSRLTGGFHQVPVLITGLPYDQCFTGLSNDGTDHHDSANATMLGIQQNLPNVRSQFRFVDTANPTKLLTEAVTNEWVVQFWLHFWQKALPDIAHRAWKEYQKAELGVSPVTLAW